MYQDGKQTGTTRHHHNMDCTRPEQRCTQHPHTERPTLHTQTPQSTPHMICLPSLNICALSQNFSDTNDRILVMIEQLRQIEAYLRAKQQLHRPFSPTTTTVSNNANPSQHTFPAPVHHNDNPEPKVDPTPDTATNSPTFQPGCNHQHLQYNQQQTQSTLTNPRNLLSNHPSHRVYTDDQHSH